MTLVTTWNILDVEDATTALRYLLFKSIPNDRFFRSFSWQFYLLSEILPEICREEVAEKIFACIVVYARRASRLKFILFAMICDPKKKIQFHGCHTFRLHPSYGTLWCILHLNLHLHPYNV